MVLHIAEVDVWDRARAEGGPYVPSEFASDGFVHCSTEEQVGRTLATWYAGRSDLVILTIDADLAGDALVFEPGSLGEDELFPHLYAAIELDWVSAVTPVQRLR